MKPTTDKLAISGAVEQVEIFELDDRLELAADPLFQLGDSAAIPAASVLIRPDNKPECGFSLRAEAAFRYP